MTIYMIRVQGKPRHRVWQGRLEPMPAAFTAAGLSKEIYQGFDRAAYEKEERSAEALLEAQGLI